MRHSTITLTSDVYGHLIAGAKAAAIASTADMTSVAEIIAATGTDGASLATETCFPFAAKRVAKQCVDIASGCDEIDAVSNGPEDDNATIPYNELQPPAPGCESVLQFAGSLGAVAQWLELGTHNP